jgi:LPS-assembly protein
MVAADRFQNFIDTSGEQLRILHVPSLELDALDHSLGGSGFYWSGRIAADGLERAQPNFSTSGVVERFDIYPHVGYVWHGGGWTLRPEIAARETFYSRSQTERNNSPWLHFQGPTEVDASTHRNDAEASVDVLAPAVEREFGGTDGDSSGWGFRHVVQPEVHYRFVGGVHDFSSILRFDSTDIVSDTNEVEYGVAQRLFVKHRRSRACKVVRSRRRRALFATTTSRRRFAGTSHRNILWIPRLAVRLYRSIAMFWRRRSIFPAQLT